jgi:hypothetical protein
MSSAIQILQGTVTWLPVVAANTGAGDPRTGILFSEVDVSYKKSSGATFALKTLDISEWRENGNGVYEIKFSASDLNTVGSFLYAVNGNGTLASPAIRQFVGQAYVTTSSTYTPGTVTLSTNVLTGNLVNLQGAAIVDAAVSARVLSAPAIEGAALPNMAGVSTDLVSARTDSAGFFALELIQGSIVDIVISRINYRRTLTVPANVTDILWDIP